MNPESELNEVLSDVAELTDTDPEDVPETARERRNRLQRVRRAALRPQPVRRDPLANETPRERRNRRQRERRAALREEARNQLRSLLVLIFVFSDPLNLWNTHKADICDDCAHILSQRGIEEPTMEQVESLALHYISKSLEEHGKTLDDYSMPHPTVDIELLRTNRLIEEELDYPAEDLLRSVPQDIAGLNVEQLEAFDNIIGACERREGKIFFIDGPGGTGKTHLENLILRRIRSRKDIAVAVASSGIASLLLEGGRTAHSRLKIPIELDSTSVCSIRKQSDLAELLRRTTLLLWDEAPMTNKQAFEAVDRSLRDITGRDSPFGGIVIVMSGDFRQVLPVVPKGNRAEIVSASIKESYLWRHVKVLRLRVNMRAGALDIFEDLGNRTFAQWLLDLGDNKLPVAEEDFIICPQHMRVTPNTSKTLVDTIYPGIATGEERFRTKEYLSERAILAPRNDEVRRINTDILNLLPGEFSEYLSADQADDPDAAATLPMEFLNTLEVSGLPSHKLLLKTNCCVMLLRNLAPSQGLCNGTRLIVKQCRPHVIEAEVLTGKKAGNIVFIPRIALISDNSGFPFALRRRQFPLRVAYAMTINKAQGQTLKYVGLSLEDDVFSHGQLYVAFSRATSPSNVKVLLGNSSKAENGLMRNVVYEEALL